MLLLLGALALGCGWYGALRGLPLQPAFVLGCLLFALVVAGLSRAGALGIPGPDRALLLVPGAFLVAAMLWRDAEGLLVLDAATLIVLAALVVPDASGRPLLLAGAAAYAERVLRAGVGWCVGMIPLSADAVSATPRTGAWRSLAAAGLGVAAISPALMVFGALLSSSDPAFGRVLESVVAIDLGPVLPHLAGIAFATWCAGGLLWAAARQPGAGLPLGVVAGRASATTVFTALIAVEALFGLFVVMQSRYLFGGYAHVLAAEGMTVAEYARRGFFELLAVAGLTLPILLLADWLLQERTPADRPRFRLHVVGLVGLLFLLLASALSRMLLYTREFGLTESRVYATGCLAWLAIVFGWLAVVHVRGTPARFAGGAFAAALQVLLALNLVDVDGLIVRVNAARAAEGRTFDRAYLLRLGAGAVPQVLRAAGTMPIGERCALLQDMHARWQARSRATTDGWNVERLRATGPLLRELARRADADCGGTMTLRPEPSQRGVSAP